MTIERDCEIIAMALFAFGTKSEVTFGTPSRIHPRTKAALDKLVKDGKVSF